MTPWRLTAARRAPRMVAIEGRSDSQYANSSGRTLSIKFRPRSLSTPICNHACGPETMGSGLLTLQQRGEAALFWVCPDAHA